MPTLLATEVDDHCWRIDVHNEASAEGHGEVRMEKTKLAHERCLQTMPHNANTTRFVFSSLGTRVILTTASQCYARRQHHFTCGHNGMLEAGLAVSICEIDQRRIPIILIGTCMEAKYTSKENQTAHKLAVSSLEKYSPP